ncbi:MAG TPA: hypothetical protein VJ895_02620 [Candidatus Nanoarchaeia archaeon]|nr:hypothetical protein [Candidatus Nanoarchaeia archaeon]
MAKKKKSKKKQEELIHIRLDYLEARKGKTELLSSQMNLLKIIQIINKYKELRMQELENKKNIQLKLKQTNNNIKKLQKLLPKYKIPKILESVMEKEENKVLEDKKEIKIESKNTLESQVKEIQEKLKSLQE